MEILFSKKFIKQADSLPSHTKLALKALIDHIKDSRDLSQLPHVKKLQHPGSFYRIRIGDYRIGFELSENNQVLFKAAAHRKDIYKLFP